MRSFLSLVFSITLCFSSYGQCIADQVLSAPVSSCGSSSTITMAGSESGIVYTLKRASDLSDVSSAFGTGGSLTFDTGELTGPTDFVVSAESDKQSIYLDGQQSGMYFPENDVLDMTDNFTIEGWIKPNGTLGWSRVFNKDNSYALGLSSSQSRLTFSVHSTADYWVEYAFVTGEWYHIACTYSAGVVEFYVNGQSAGSQSNVATPTLRDYGARLGAGQNGSYNRFKGNINNVRVWNEVRTPMQIASNMNKYLAGGPNTPGLAASWWLIEGDGTAFDYSVNELHGVEQDVLWEENVPHEVCSFDLSTMLTVETINIIDQDVVAYETIVCSGGETIIELYETQPEITYILKNESTGQLIDGPYVGDGGTITFITGPIAGPNFFNVHAMAIQGTTVMCEQIMSVVPFINGIDDLEAPIVIGLESIESPCALEEIQTPIAMDECQGMITGTTSTNFPITEQGITIVNWTFDDGYGNIATQTQEITIADTEPAVPTIADLPVIQQNCMMEEIAPPTAMDNCAGMLTAYTTTQFPIFEEGITLVTWFYDDGNGNISSQVQEVIIAENVPPVPELPQLEDINEACQATLVTPMAMDDCAGPIPGIADVSFPITTQGLTVVTWAYIDPQGNITTQTQNVLIEDNEAPVLVAPEALTISTNNIGCTAIFDLGGEVVTDNCSILSVTNDAPEFYEMGTTIVTWTAMDLSGNITEATQEVFVTSDLVAEVIDVVQPSTCGLMDASINMDVIGGTPPYEFNWNDGEYTTQNITSTGPGSYFVIITDANGCTTTATADVSDPNAPEIFIASVSPPSCYGSNDGTILIEVTGGSGNYTYDWSTDGIGDNDDDQINTDAGVGDVSITVTDSNGCQSFQTINVDGPDAIVFEQSFTVCDGELIVVDGNVYNEDGVYTDIFISSTGCDSTVTTTLDVLDAIDASVETTDNGLMAVTQGASYQWYDCNLELLIPGATGQEYIPEGPGLFSVSVTTSGGCTTFSDCVAHRPLSIDDMFPELLVNVYPVPTTGLVNVRLDNIQQNVHMTLRDMQGKEILDQEYSNTGFFSFDIIGESGVYLLSLSGDNGEQTIVRLIKE